MKIAKIIVLSIGLMVAFFFALIVGLALLATVVEPYDNDVPQCENGQDCQFQVTSRNVQGNGNYWVYGENRDGYYSSLMGTDKTPHYLHIPKGTAQICTGFDPHDILTWQACLPQITLDCDAIKDAKTAYETYSSATAGQDRYQNSGRWEYDYSCDYPEN